MGTPVIHREINVFTCLNDPTRSPIAMIDGFPMIFTGQTPFRARKSADDWRRKATQGDKLIPAHMKAEWLGEVSA